MNFPFYIAKRYLHSKSSQNAVNIINFITFLVIVIGSAALFIVLSGFAGLKTFSLSFTNVFDPDIKVTPQTGKFFTISPSQEEQLKNMEGLASYSKELEEKVLLYHREKSHIAFVKGVDRQYNKVTGVDSTIIYGTWTINEVQGVAGIEISNLLGIGTDQYRNPLMIAALKPGKGFISPQSKKAIYNELPIVLSGVYGVEESLDKKYVFADLDSVRRLLEKDSTQLSGINIKVHHEKDIPSIKNEIAAVFKNTVSVKNRKEQNSTLYKMLNTENVATYLIFTLVLVIALFNVVGAITMMILDKKQNSKTLYSLGTTLKELRRIYFVQGVLVTTLGGGIGVLLGSLLIGSQVFFEWFKITASLAYPVEFQFMNVLIVLATIMVLGIVAAKIASSRINKKLITS